VGLDDKDTAVRYKNLRIILPIILKEYIEDFDDKNNLEKYIGLKVFDENDQYVGEIYEYYNFNGNIVFKINRDNKYFLLSYNQEHVVSENFIQHKLTVLRFGLVEHNI
jgi:ribosomal 30S subunit maturation factor RimM